MNEPLDEENSLSLEELRKHITDYEQAMDEAFQGNKLPWGEEFCRRQDKLDAEELKQMRHVVACSGAILALIDRAMEHGLTERLPLSY